MLLIPLLSVSRCFLVFLRFLQFTKSRKIQKNGHHESPYNNCKIGNKLESQAPVVDQPKNPKTLTLTEAREKVPAPGILSREARTSGKKRLGGFIVTGMHTEEKQRGALEGVLEVGINAAQLQQPPQLRQLLLPEVDDATKSLETSASGSCITQVLHPRLLLSLYVPVAPQKTAAFQKKN